MNEIASIAPVVVNKQKEGTVDYAATEREDSLSRATTADPLTPALSMAPASTPFHNTTRDSHTSGRTITAS